MALRVMVDARIGYARTPTRVQAPAKQGRQREGAPKRLATLLEPGEEKEKEKEAGEDAGKVEGLLPSNVAALVFSYPPEVERDARARLDHLAVAMAYSRLAADCAGAALAPLAGISIDLGGYRASVLVDFESASLVADKHKQVVIATGQPALTLSARRLTQNSRAFTGFSKDFIEEEGVFLEILLTPYEQATLTLRDIRRALSEKYRLLVFRSNQKQVKIEGEEEGDEVSLGEEYRTEKVNIQCKPIGKTALEYDWPTTIEFVKDKEPFFLSYRLGSGNGGIHQALKAARCLTKCHKLLAECKCNEKKAERMSISGEKRPRSELGKEQGEARAKGMRYFLEKAGLKPEDCICPKFSKGDCVHVREGRPRHCKMIHAGDPKFIECKYGLDCRHIRKCRYNHKGGSARD